MSGQHTGGENGARVKPLEWRDPTDHPQDGFGDDNIVAVANGIGGRYSVDRQKDGTFLLWFAHDEFLWAACPTVESCKQLAEVDWQRRAAIALASHIKKENQ